MTLNNNPFANPEYPIREGLRIKDVKADAYFAQQFKRRTFEDKSLDSKLMLISQEGNYAFPKISYQGRVLPSVELSSTLLDVGKSKTQNEWKTFSMENIKSWEVPEIELFYQLMRRLYGLRNDKEYFPIAQECTEMLRKQFNDSYLMTFTRIKYNKGLEAIVGHRSPRLTPTKSSIIKIPEFKRHDIGDELSYLVLADKQSKNKTGAAQPMPNNAKLTLKTLLGRSYEQAGDVFQYFSALKGRKFKETRFWAPTAENRNIESAVVLGIGRERRFDIVTGVHLARGNPAFGVRTEQCNIKVR